MVIMDEQYNGIPLELGDNHHQQNHHHQHQYVLKNGVVHQSGAFHNSTNQLRNGINNVGQSISSGIQSIPSEIQLLRDRVVNKDYFLMTEQTEIEEDQRDQLYSSSTKSISSKQLLKRPLGIKDNNTGADETYCDTNSNHRFRSWSSPSVPLPKVEASVPSSENKNLKSLTLPRVTSKYSSNPHHFTLIKKKYSNNYSEEDDDDESGIIEVDEECLQYQEEEDEEEEEEELTRISMMSIQQDHPSFSSSTSTSTPPISISSSSPDKYKSMMMMEESESKTSSFSITNSGILILERTNSTNSLDCMADTEYQVNYYHPNQRHNLPTTPRNTNTPSPRTISVRSPSPITTITSSSSSNNLSPRSVSLMPISNPKIINTSNNSNNIIKAKPIPPPRSPASLKHSGSLAVPIITTTSASTSPNGSTSVSPSPSPLSLSSNNTPTPGRSLTPTIQFLQQPSRNQLSMSSPKIIINKHLVRCDSNGSISSTSNKSGSGSSASSNESSSSSSPSQSHSSSASSSPTQSPKKSKTIALSKSKSSGNVPTSQQQTKSSLVPGTSSPLVSSNNATGGGVGGINILFQNELKQHLKAKELRKVNNNNS